MMPFEVNEAKVSKSKLSRKEKKVFGQKMRFALVCIAFSNKTSLHIVLGFGIASLVQKKREHHRAPPIAEYIIC